jgi:hypothetical protein
VAGVGFDVAGKGEGQCWWGGLDVDGLGLFVSLWSFFLFFFTFGCGFRLTSFVGLIMGNAWKLVLKKPIQRNVVFWARDGKVSFMISAAWSLPCDIS